MGSQECTSTNVDFDLNSSGLAYIFASQTVSQFTPSDAQQRKARWDWEGEPRSSLFWFAQMSWCWVFGDPCELQVSRTSEPGGGPVNDIVQRLHELSKGVGWPAVPHVVLHSWPAVLPTLASRSPLRIGNEIKVSLNNFNCVLAVEWIFKGKISTYTLCSLWKHQIYGCYWIPKFNLSSF